MPRQPVRHSQHWTIIIPVKETSAAKTRLSHLMQPARAALALAFAMDAATAAVGCPVVRRVVAVTNDGMAGEALAGIGVDIVPDQPEGGLNAALEYGFMTVRREEPGVSVAAMSGDLPALRAEDLALVFALAHDVPRWFVPDGDGGGTTMLGASHQATLSPAFGTDSRQRHLVGGAAEIADGRLVRLRRDVDTAAHLDQALLLGLGAYTRAALASLDASCRA